MDPEECTELTWSFDDEIGVGEVALDRPDELNALSERLRAEIEAVFDEFEARDDEHDGVVLRAVILRGNGDEAFSAGADITEFADGPSPGDLAMPEAYGRPAACPAPVVAEIDGYCLGGGFELALASDFRFASERSTFGMPEANIGLIPAGGGTQRLSEVVPASVAKRLIMLGEHLSAADAAELGLVDEVVPAGDLDATVREFADRLAEQPPLAVRAAKDTVDAAQTLGLEEGLRYERRVGNLLKETADHEEGRKAFVEDHEPTWEGR